MPQNENNKSSIFKLNKASWNNKNLLDIAKIADKFLKFPTAAQVGTLFCFLGGLAGVLLNKYFKSGDIVTFFISMSSLSFGVLWARGGLNLIFKERKIEARKKEMELELIEENHRLSKSQILITKQLESKALIEAEIIKSIKALPKDSPEEIKLLHYENLAKLNTIETNELEKLIKTNNNQNQE